LSRPDELPVFVIQRTSGWRLLDLRELWNYRELVYFLTWRDIKVRYKQTAIGIVWALLQPLAMIVVFSLFFGKLAGGQSEGLPYALFTLTALLPWQLFSRSISESTNSLVTDQKLITRVYFPRIIVPAATNLAAVVDFFIAFGLLILMMVFYGVVPQSAVVWFPIFIGLMIIASMGVGFWLSALNVEYRDVMYTVPFLNQLWFFATPIVYPSSIVPMKFRALYALNPMVGVVEGFRWSLLGTQQPPISVLLTSAAISVFLFLSGIMWFRRRERTFVDAVGSGGR
jgi:lipopolysaccharide transport system permease protein